MGVGFCCCNEYEGRSHFIPKIAIEHLLVGQFRVFAEVWTKKTHKISKLGEIEILLPLDIQKRL